MAEEPMNGNGNGGGGGGPFLSGVTSDDVRLATLSMLVERFNFARQNGMTFGGLRDEYTIFGYDRTISNRQYREEYARGGLAGRIVDAMPNATWRGSMEIIEDEDPETETPFEKAWTDLDTKHQIRAKLHRVDKLAGLSTYAVLLIGAVGDLSTELPKGKPEKLLYFQPFSGGGAPGINGNTSMSASFDADATIQEYETDSQNPRFGLPKFYQLKRTQLASPAFGRPVHWTRIIHIAEGVLDDDVFGIPALERVWNLLIDLRKVTGGGAEAFFLRANQGMHLDIDKDMSNLEQPQLDDLKAQAEEYQHQVRRMLRTKGVSVEMLGSDVANFSNPADAIITQIAGAKSIPKRILTGSEMGELASSQDRDNWKDQVNGRQTGYADPYIVRPLVDRLIKYGYLPTPKDGPMAYQVKWPQITTMTEQEKSTGANSWASVNQTYGSVVFTDAEIREKWADKPPLDDEQLKAIADANAEKIKQQQELMKAQQPEQPAKDKEAPPEARPRAAEERKFSSTEVRLPQAIGDKLLAFGIGILQEDLHEEGCEHTPHVTVKYGLHTNDVGDVRVAMTDFVGPIRLTLGMTDYFETDEYDVLYVRVSSPDLVRLNALLSNRLAVTDTHPTYTPHATIAYLKKGMGEKYAGDDRLSGMAATIDTVTFGPAVGLVVTADQTIDVSMKIASQTMEDEEILRELAEALQCGATEVIDHFLRNVDA